MLFELSLDFTQNIFCCAATKRKRARERIGKNVNEREMCFVFYKERLFFVRLCVFSGFLKNRMEKEEYKKKKLKGKDRNYFWSF
jgi:hypothetical protein